MKDTPLSRNERDFVRDALLAGVRVDGRGMFDYRKVAVSFGLAKGHVEVTIGGTKVLAQTSCEVVEPSSHRPAEGVIRYSVEFSPMAAPSFQTGRPPPAAVEVLRVVERALKESRAVETESLCIVAGEKVWAVRVDVTVLDHCGNLADAVALAALASLLHFRKPHVEVIGSEVTIHTLQSHTPDALSVHHRPVCVSFAFVGDGSEAAAVDPSLVEEEVAVGSLTLALNVHRELCAVHKLGGATVTPARLVECVEIAHVKAAELSACLDAALKADEVARTTVVQRPPSLIELSRQRITAAAARDPGPVPMEEVHGDESVAAAASAAVAMAETPVVLGGGAGAGLFAGGTPRGGTAWDEN